MTEHDWLTTDDPLAAFRFLAGMKSDRVSRWMAFVGIPTHPIPDRKLRLYLCSWFRHVADAFPAEWSTATADVLDTAERVADGDALPGDVISVAQSYWNIVSGTDENPSPVDITETVATERLHKIARWRTSALRLGVPDLELEEQIRIVLGARQSDPSLANLVRCIFENPFHRPEFRNSWRNSTVLGLAEKVYEDRTFGHLPILADALEEGGCEESAILDHSRHPGPHGRGCWVIDRILGLG